MRNFLQNLGYKMNQFMYGRYGSDNMNRTLSWVVVAFFVISLIPKLNFMLLLGLALEIYLLFRMMSKNIYKRQQENMKYMELTKGIRSKSNLYINMFKERKEFSYYKCPQCKTYVRIRKPPKGKSIAVKCRKCGNEFVKKT